MSEAITAERMELYVLRENQALEVKISKRLDAQDAVMDKVREDVVKLTGDETFPGVVPRMEKTLNDFVVEQRSANGQAAEHRSTTNTRLDALERREVRVWLHRAYRRSMIVVREGGDTAKFLSAGGILWIGVVQFIHTVWPWLRLHWLHR